MTILFTHAWEILSEKEDEYNLFVARHFIPKCNEMGLVSVGGYYVEAGVGPRIISVKGVASLEELGRIMSTPGYKELMHDLKQYITGYSTKVLQPTGRTKKVEYQIQKGVWKYNQYYDLRPGMRRQYAEFIVNKYLPMLDSLDYLEVTGGWNVLIGGTSEIIGELTFKDPVDIAMLLKDENFRQLTHDLKKDYVTNYSSRILRTTERFEEPRWFRL